MKTSKFLFVLFLATATLLSCSKDDDDDKITPEASIVGIWKLDSQSLNGEPDPLENCEDQTSFVFDESELTSFTYEGEECEIEEVLVYDYTLEDETLTLRAGDLTAVYNVDKLTETDLHLSHIYNDNVIVAKFKRE